MTLGLSGSVRMFSGCVCGCCFINCINSVSSIFNYLVTCLSIISAGADFRLDMKNCKLFIYILCELIIVLFQQPPWPLFIIFQQSTTPNPITFNHEDFCRPVLRLVIDKTTKKVFNYMFLVEYFIFLENSVSGKVTVTLCL